MCQPLLSIVVPTKNRYYYLKYLIKLVESLNSKEIEMVIQDNSDDNCDFVNYLNDNKYTFIKYDYIKGQIPMSDNADKGILNSSGEYVCFLGDDDGLTKYILDCVRWMKTNEIEALKPASLNYCWPDAPQGRHADICYYPFSAKVLYLSPYKELVKVLKTGICSRGNMPLAYHAIVARRALDKVYSICGTFFPGNSPDISNAVALSLVVEKYALINIPIAYSGNSAYKGGGVHANGNAAPKIDEIPWFRPNPKERWNKELPRIAAGSIIWADSALEALKMMKREDLVKLFDKNKCYSNLLLAMPHLSNYVKEKLDNKCHYIYMYIASKVRKVYSALWLRCGWFFGFKSKPHYIRNVNNIQEASLMLEKISHGFALELFQKQLCIMAYNF